MPQTYIRAVAPGDVGRTCPVAVSWSRRGRGVPGIVGTSTVDQVCMLLPYVRPAIVVSPGGIPAGGSVMNGTFLSPNARKVPFITVYLRCLYPDRSRRSRSCRGRIRARGTRGSAAGDLARTPRQTRDNETLARPETPGPNQ